MMFISKHKYICAKILFKSKTNGKDMTVTVTALCEGIWSEQYDTAATVDLCPD